MNCLWWFCYAFVSCSSRGFKPVKRISNAEKSSLEILMFCNTQKYLEIIFSKVLHKTRFKMLQITKKITILWWFSGCQVLKWLEFFIPIFRHLHHGSLLTESSLMIFWQNFIFLITSDSFQSLKKKKKKDHVISWRIWEKTWKLCCMLFACHAELA